MAAQSSDQTKQWTDISVPLTAGMVHWPGEPELHFEQISDTAKGDAANVTKCTTVVHIGTHMDAPRHFLQDGAGIDAFPLETGVGRAIVIDLPDVEIVTRKELEGKGIQAGDRVLVKTRNSKLQWTTMPFQEDYVGLDSSAAQFLVDAGAVLIGVDYISVGTYNGDNPETHKTLLRNNIWIVEGLALGEVPAGRYELICLPLRIVGCDGSPARALLRAAS